MGKQAKRTFKPLQSGFTNAGSAAPTLLHTSNASRLADSLRKNVGQKYSLPSMQSEAFGPALVPKLQVSDRPCEALTASWAERAKPKVVASSKMLCQPKNISLRVSLPDGTRTTIESISETSASSAMLQRIENEHGVRASHLRLFFCGQPLDLGLSLGENGIAENGLITSSFMRPFVPMEGSSIAQHPSRALACSSEDSGQVLVQHGVQSEDSSAEVELRTVLLTRLFDILDKDRDGKLSCEEMLPFAQETGFDGTDVEWQKEFSSLCFDIDEGQAAGINIAFFMDLCNDESDDGIYCSTNEIRDIAAKLSAHDQA